MQGYPHHGFCGQNIFSKSSSHPFPEVAISEAVGSWFHEVDNFDPAEIEHFGEAGHATGEVDHFTSLAWAKVLLIYCSYLYMITIITTDHSYRVWLRGVAG